MKTNRAVLLPSFFVLILLLSAPLRAVDIDNPIAFQARTKLEQVWNPDQPLSNAAKTKLLQQALDLLHKSPRATHGDRRRAMEAIKSALYELERGDPDHKADDYIHTAVDQVRDMT
jgi:hypothetical protein